VAVSQDKPPHSIPPGVAGRDRAWEPANSATGNHIQAGHIPQARGIARLRNGERSWSPHPAQWQSGHHQSNGQPAYDNSHPHNRYCRTHATQLLKVYIPPVQRGRFRQIRRLKAIGRETASRWKFFGSEKRKDTPQRPILASETLGVKKNMTSFAQCTEGGATRFALITWPFV
jgi:hypothetical protein